MSNEPFTSVTLPQSIADGMAARIEALEHAAEMDTGMLAEARSRIEELDSQLLAQHRAEYARGILRRVELEARIASLTTLLRVCRGCLRACADYDFSQEIAMIDAALDEAKQELGNTMTPARSQDASES